MSEDNDSSGRKWLICVDTGGTFTDCLALDPAGIWHRAKVLSSSALRGTIRQKIASDTIVISESWHAPIPFVTGFPFRLLDGSNFQTTVREHSAGHLHLEDTLPSGDLISVPFEVISPDEAPILAVRLVTQTIAGAPLPPNSLRLATTRGTNALLTRGGAPPAFFVTAGHADLLFIGTQQRPDLFALDITRPEPLYSEVIEIQERLNANGSVLRLLDEEAVHVAAAHLSERGIQTAAVCLLHSYLSPEHERQVAAILRAHGFIHISLSSDLAPFIKAVPRAQTALVNAYLAPIMNSYVERVGQVASDSLHLMTSAGGLVTAADFQPRDSLLSGPAGGIVGAATAGRHAGFTKIIAFDMGGTSTDVARYDGDFEYSFEHGVGDAHLVAPALAIESVAAGGGSICFADAQGLRVGPESAGANPGPACYGAGGPLTITDVNLLLGRILPGRFEIPLSVVAAERAADALVANYNRVTGKPYEREEVLHALADIANERMADAIRKISVRRGYDPSDYALVSFGGAGGQHACAVAERLGIRTVLVPPDASLLSAFGLANAAIERFVERQILKRLGEGGITEMEVLQLRSELAEEAFALLRRTDSNREPQIRRFQVRLRLLGQDSSIDIEVDDKPSLARIFAERYRAIYGHFPPEDRPIEVESVRVVADLGRPNLPPNRKSGDAAPQGNPSQMVYERDALTEESLIPGPSLIVEAHSVVVVPNGWHCSLHPDSGALILQQRETIRKEPLRQDAFLTELFAARFTAIAEEMGEMLRRTALSTNVKERLDFSCAVMNAEGELIASAAHIPVHLGALGVCVRRIKETVTLAPGDVIVTNHPAFGGSHLPDITLVTPVFVNDSDLIGFVASRAHHAEIGGIRPGSMPPNAKTLAEEGVVIPPFPLVRRGELRLDALCDLLTGAPYPTRAVSDNRADLEAALAANHRGANGLIDLALAYGISTVSEQMDALIARSERLVRAALAALPDGEYSATEHLDDGTVLCVRLIKTGDGATIDFTGTSGTHSGNRNAPPAVTQAAVLYVLRLLIGEPIPLNEGILRPITLVLPPDTLVHPTFDATDPAKCPAVVGGNVETSQRIVDTLLKALGLCAASQGTMNNTLWGTDTFGYYETVCGGAGATSNAPGASCVHTHMTNTRITDVEIIERRYPVRIERFARRHGSGGEGKHPGGDGIIRETIFLAPMALSVLTERRQSGPYGIAGGEDGLPGRQTMIRRDGTLRGLSSTDGAEVQPGDRLILETPGGGGWGTGS